MVRVDEAEAKAIVKRDLASWRGTFNEFKLIQGELFAGAKRITSVESREIILKKNIKKFYGRFYCKEVLAEFSHTVAVLGCVPDEAVDIDLSRSKRQEQARVQAQLARHLHKIKNNKIHVVVVKNDHVKPLDELLLIIYSTRGKILRELASFHSVATISKHCLERLVYRLNLSNVYEAIDEVLGAIVWLEGSGDELAKRSSGGYGKGFKRHIPTPNGALLLNTSSVTNPGYLPSQECTLVTWIHNKQFKRNQEVTKSEFIFVQIVNYYLSDPELGKRLHEFELVIDEIKKTNSNADVKFNIHGENYSSDEFMQALEKGMYLDFDIDFEKGLKNAGST